MDKNIKRLLKEMSGEYKEWKMLYEHNGKYVVKVTNENGEKAVLKIFKNMDVAENEITVHTYLKEKDITNYKNYCVELLKCETRNDIYVLTYEAGDSDAFDVMLSFNKEQKIKCIRDLRDIIVWLHSMNCIHLDIKPENIIVFNKTHEGSAGKYEASSNFKICDFEFSVIGISKHHFHYDILQQHGTDAYVDPHAMDTHNYQHSNDIFSFFVATIIILTGNVPHHSKDPLKGKNYQTRCLNRYSPEMRDLISKSLIYEPSDRIGIDEFITKAISSLTP